LLERCANDTAGEVQHEITWLAEGLSCLGFYLDPCTHGKEPDERATNLYFARYEKEQGFEALLSLSQQIPLNERSADATATPAATTAPAPAPLPAAPAVPQPAGADREMLEVFLEEANEVLSAMEPNIHAARAHPGNNDALINVRRAFHTLKGSSRIVGLTAFGECAWELEQVMNQWLAQTLAPTPELLAVADDARTLLAEWAHALQGETEPQIDDRDIMNRARALRGAAPLPAKPVSAPATTVAAPSPEPANVAPVVAPAVAPIEPPAPALAAPLAIPTIVTTAITAAQPPSRDQLVAQIEDNLGALNDLVHALQHETDGPVPPRLKEIAQALGKNMSELTDAHRKLTLASTARHNSA
jgi:chemosensory pili system protein ChpA (sensor histidine kinase/response regulator)